MSKKEKVAIPNTESEPGSDSDEEKRGERQLIPAFMAASLRREYLQEMIKTLPSAVQNRITVLKNLQIEHLQLEAQFFEKIYKLEMQYHQKYLPLFEKRKQIISGEVEPEIEEPKWKPEEEKDIDEKDKAALMKMIKESDRVPEDAKGIPGFWLKVFRNVEILSEMIQDHDEPLLQKLNDITVKYTDEHSYILEFHFDKNDYFTDSVLTKQYFLKATVDTDSPFAYEGPEIYNCQGCTINWEKKMNLTVKTIRKKQKHKELGAVRTVVKHVPNDSFFNFFNPPQLPEDKNEMDEDSQGVLATDFEIGHFFRARIIPKAVLYYTGDIVDDDDDEEYDGEEEDEDEGSEDEQTTNQTSAVLKKKNTPNDCPNQ